MKRLLVTAFALAMTAALSNIAKADQPGMDWMPAAQVKEKLMAAGYSSVTKIEADDGHWEGEGMKNGKKMQFHADPKTGAIMSEKVDH